MYTYTYVHMCIYICTQIGSHIYNTQASSKRKRECGYRASLVALCLTIRHPPICVRGSCEWETQLQRHTHTHTHALTHMYKYIMQTGYKDSKEILVWYTHKQVTHTYTLIFDGKTWNQKGAPRMCKHTCTHAHTILSLSHTHTHTLFLMGTVTLYRICWTGLR